jgi:hypothetical protein
MDNSSIILQSDRLRRRPTPAKIAALRVHNDHRGSLRLASVEPACLRDLPGFTLRLGKILIARQLSSGTSLSIARRFLVRDQPSQESTGLDHGIRRGDDRQATAGQRGDFVAGVFDSNFCDSIADGDNRPVGEKPTLHDALGQYARCPQRLIDPYVSHHALLRRPK